MSVEPTLNHNCQELNLIETNKAIKQRKLYYLNGNKPLENNKLRMNSMYIVKLLGKNAQIRYLEELKRGTVDCSEATLLNYGYLAYVKLFKEIGISECIKSIKSKDSPQFPFLKTLLNILLQNLLGTRSRDLTFDRQEQYFGLRVAKLQHIYRALEIVSAEKIFIESQLWEQNSKTAISKHEAILYCGIDLDFPNVIPDEFINSGFSKYCNTKKVKKTLGMLMDKSGIPMSYETFDNISDQNVLIKTLETWKKRFGLSRIIILAENTQNSIIELTKLKKAGYDYLLITESANTNNCKQRENFFFYLEKSFKMLPVYRWTPKRIQGYCVICFLAYLVERKLEILINEEVEKEHSLRAIREALNSAQLAAVKLKNEEIYIKVENHPLSNKIFNNLRLALPQNINNKEEIERWFYKMQLNTNLAYVKMEL